MIKSQPHRQSEQTKNILAHLAENEPCNFDALFALFGGELCDRVAKNRMHQRLSYLVCKGLLRATSRHGQRYWGVPRADDSSEPNTDQDPPAWVGSVAQSPGNDVMHCPVYVPDQGPALRRGALDFKRYASVGDRC